MIPVYFRHIDEATERVLLCYAQADELDELVPAIQRWGWYYGPLGETGTGASGQFFADLNGKAGFEIILESAE